MSQGIYIVGAEPRSGKSVIVLGMMEMLSGRMGKVGFFRPVVRDERKPDNITTLIIKRYGLDLSYEKLYGCGYDMARDMFSRNRDEDLLKMILGKYRDLERECDLIVCAGSDYAGPAIPLEFDFNAKLANNLGCAVLPVVQGYGRDTMQVVTAARGLLESLEERKCDSPRPRCQSGSGLPCRCGRRRAEAGAAAGYSRLCTPRTPDPRKTDGR